MSEHEAESASPSAVPFTMTARKGRLSAAVQAAQLITMAIPLAGYLSQGGPGAGGIVAALLALIPDGHSKGKYSTLVLQGWCWHCLP
jgi:hypothetical protein